MLTRWTFEGPGKQTQLCLASATRRSRSEPVVGIPGRAAVVRLEICVCCQSVPPPISHRAPLSVAIPSRQTVLIALLKYQDLCPAGRAHSPFDVRCQKKENLIKPFGSLVRTNRSERRFGTFGRGKDSRQRMSRDNSALSSPMSLISFPSAESAQPGSKKKLAR